MGSVKLIRLAHRMSVLHIILLNIAYVDSLTPSGVISLVTKINFLVENMIELSASYYILSTLKGKLASFRVISIALANCEATLSYEGKR